MSPALRRALLATVVYLVVLATAVPVLLYRLTPPTDTLTLTQAEFAHDAHTADVTLPHEWRDAADDTPRATYQLRFDLAEIPTDLQAVVLPTVRYNATVSLNGRVVGSAGRMSPPVSRNPRRALLFPVTNDLLQRGENRLTVKLARAPDGIGYLDRVLFGPERVLRDQVNRHAVLRLTIPKGITLLVFVMSIVIGALAFVRRREVDYLYFSLGTFVWAIHSLAYIVTDVPFGDRAFDWMRFVTMGLFAYIGGVLYTHRYMGVRHPQLEFRLALLVAAGALVLGVVDRGAFYTATYYLWHPFCIALAGYGMTRLMLRAYRRNDIEAHVIAASAMALLVFGLHDLATTWGYAPWHRGYVLHYAMAFTLAIFCGVLLRRFVGALNEAERLNRDLEARVQATRTELDETFRENQKLENRRVVAEERDRIMRDMHDGMGGQLITTLALIEDNKTSTDRVATALRAALQDLRLMIDSLDVAGEDITTMLGMFRSRIEPSLQAHDIRLVWKVEPIGDIPNFGSAKALHVLRILQEAVTNVIKHSGASEVTLSAKDRARPGGGRQVTISVQDNGRGLPETPGAGRGLANMKSRALTIGAMFEARPTDDGTQVLLKLSR
ncbi:MAG: ATP-binding protein [Pseudomonadota bacterium]